MNSSSSPAPSSPRRWFVVAVVAGAIIISVLIVPPAIRESTQRAECRRRLKAIVMALQAYHGEYKMYPPAYTADATGHRLHSWRVLILPELGYDALYARYRFDEPWDGPHNRRLIAEMPAEYGCPSGLSKAPGVTNYVAVVGCQTAWPAPYSARVEAATDGTSNSLQVVESCDLEACWTEPRDLSYDEYVRGVNAREHPGFSSRHAGGALAAPMDAEPLFLSQKTDWKVLHRFATISSGTLWPGCDPPVEYADEYSLSLRPANALTKTEVLPVLETPVASAQNIVYCCTFQIVWDDLRESLGLRSLQLESDPPLAAHLNAGRFPRSSLSSECYVVKAGRTNDGVRGQFDAARQKRFPRASLPQPTPLSGSSLAAYCYLEKRLPFEHKFPKLDEPLRFQAVDGVQPVLNWGLLAGRELKGTAAETAKQVQILDYVDDRDFVLRLSTRTDWIVLAKVTPKPTLADTWQTVGQRLRNPRTHGQRRSLFPNEPFVVPRIALFVERDYHELLGLPILNVPGRLPFGAAKQYIKFQLDESGARLESLAEAIAVGLDDEEDRPPDRPRQFVFDRPFLLALQQRNAEVPYFVLWIANAELLVAPQQPAAAKQKPTR